MFILHDQPIDFVIKELKGFLCLYLIGQFFLFVLDLLAEGGA